MIEMRKLLSKFSSKYTTNFIYYLEKIIRYFLRNNAPTPFSPVILGFLFTIYYLSIVVLKLKNHLTSWIRLRRSYLLLLFQKEDEKEKGEKNSIYLLGIEVFVWLLSRIKSVLSFSSSNIFTNLFSLVSLTQSKSFWSHMETKFKN